jgi:hypothetical protein
MSLRAVSRTGTGNGGGESGTGCGAPGRGDAEWMYAFGRGTGTRMSVKRKSHNLDEAPRRRPRRVLGASLHDEGFLARRCDDLLRIGPCTARVSHER